MAVIFIAPYGDFDTAISLPNPQPGDKQQSKSSMSVLRGMDGTVYTYVRANKWTVLNYEFNVQRLKGYELKGFIQSYHSADWLMVDYNGVSWRVKLKTNPTEIVSTKWDNLNFEWNNIKLEFEGVLL